MQVGWLCLKGEKRIFGLAADGRIRAQCRFHSSAPWLHGTMGRVLWEGGPRNKMSLDKVAPALWACVASPSCPFSADARYMAVQTAASHFNMEVSQVKTT